MHGYTFYALILMYVSSVSQRYNELTIETPSGRKFHKILPYRREFMYEVKTCKDASVVLYKQGTTTFTYRIGIFPRSSSTGLKLSKYPSSFTFLEESWISSLTCDQFVKFKFSWSNDNLTLWTARLTGWDTLLTWNDPSLYAEGFEYVHFYGTPAEWKVYQIEHTEKPFKVTCINF